ncbi:DUF952 domain-containing protein [Thermocoleostomius sinensis]|uniref:DUF952 domain-containing protein n=1 Tax=Thermocoleostomius sinensis A174 TaxID=2016057 RepID=A0A9E9C7X9_9CYAN|nr:DUF952 domain-containing protein [Thermocoleostomius sinensis]WAL60829.1 DUF952 domain-containing protein [Thermocoleostomius sinensis A174]
MQSVFHITPQQAWNVAQAQGLYRCESLDTEGFIHCSTQLQVIRVANAFYRGQTGLVLLQIDADRLQADLRYDPIETGEAFPHLYGPLNLEAVVQVHPFEPEADGSFELPDTLKRNVNGQP